MPAPELSATPGSVGRPERPSLGNLIKFGIPALVTSVALASCGGGSGESASTAQRAGQGNDGGNVYHPYKAPDVRLPGSRHVEVEQFGAPTFEDYVHVSGPGPQIPIGTKVVVDCLETGPLAAAPSAHGNPGESGSKWYHMVDPPKYRGFSAAANTFENGDTSGPVSSQPAEDPAVPDCPPLHRP